MLIQTNSSEILNNHQFKGISEEHKQFVSKLIAAPSDYKYYQQQLTDRSVGKINNIRLIEQRTEALLSKQQQALLPKIKRKNIIK